MKRILNLLFWLAFTAYCFIALNFTSGLRHEHICTSVEINVLDSIRSRFITAADIRQMVDARRMKMTGIRFDSINIAAIEQRLNEVAPIQRADIYKTGDGTVHIDVLQRTPALRVINRYGESFYLDQQGVMLRHSTSYSAHVLVANGHISLRPKQHETYSVLTVTDTSATRNIMRELFELAKYINGDHFWKMQIQQIYVNENGDFELIPLVGAHVIIFGTMDKADEKFAKLESFYRNGLNIKGWNTYQTINLKYNGQIVASKR
jgi:cell division protein FtsQ